MDLDVQWVENWTKVGGSARTILIELRNIGIFNLIQVSLNRLWIFAWVIYGKNHIHQIAIHNNPIQVNELSPNLQERC